MVVLGGGVAECILEGDLACGGVDEVCASDDVGDVLGGVVDDDGKGVGPVVVWFGASFEDKVIDGLGVLCAAFVLPCVAVVAKLVGVVVGVEAP